MRKQKRTPQPSDYAPADSTLASYGHGLGALKVGGVLTGYLASIVAETESREPWLWFVVVWNTGAKEKPFEDHGPLWLTVRELDAGYFDHFGPSTTSEGRFLGFQTVRSIPGSPRRFEYARLPANDAAKKWAELGLADSDF